MYAKSGRYDEAVEQLETSRQTKPRSISSCGALGEIYVEAGQVDAAEQTLRECLDLIETEKIQDDYWHGRVYFALAVVHGEKAQWGASIEAAVNAMSLLGRDPLWTSELPMRFDDALKAEPEHLDWYLKIGDAYLALEMFQDAGAFYEMAAAKWADDPRVAERVAVLKSTLDSGNKD
jgi:tetratricopeptide (TPR) repeat protein